MLLNFLFEQRSHLSQDSAGSPLIFYQISQQKYLPAGNCKQDLEFLPFWVELTCSKGLNGLSTQSAPLKVDQENQTTDVWFLSSKLIFPTVEGILSLAQY